MLSMGTYPDTSLAKLATVAIKLADKCRRAQILALSDI
jgi:hypothetical protein